MGVWPVQYTRWVGGRSDARSQFQGDAQASTVDDTSASRSGSYAALR